MMLAVRRHQVAQKVNTQMNVLTLQFLKHQDQEDQKHWTALEDEHIYM